MVSKYISLVRINLAKAQAQLDEYQRLAQATECEMKEAVVSTRAAIAASRALMYRVGRAFGRK
jgi:hypothetical protein